MWPWRQNYEPFVTDVQQGHAAASASSKGSRRTFASSEEEERISPWLLHLYIWVMVGLPLLAFFIGAIFTVMQRRADRYGPTHEPGPVTYVHYLTPMGLVEDMEMDHVWIQFPGLAENRSNAIFASTQFTFEAGNKGGYMGTQVWREGLSHPVLGQLFANRQTTHYAIFAIWDRDAFHKARPQGPNCGRFTENGEGSHCLVPCQLTLGSRYTVRLRRSGRGNYAGVAGDVWTGSIVDTQSDYSLKIGDILLEDIDGHHGYGKMRASLSGSSFQEYYQASGCDYQAVSSVGLIGPYFSGRRLVASQALSGKQACVHGDVTDCIPGDYGCGPPMVRLTAGGTTRPSRAPGTELWNARADG